jgi:diacylglycerol kinase (ATP)
MPQHVRVIMNPAAGRGRGARKLPALRSAFAAGGITDIELTTAPGDEARLARQALQDGCSTVIAVGGDGTWSKVAAALAGSDCRLALVAAGTGNDFAKSLGVPATDPVAMARLAVDGPDERIDMGRIGDRLFLNIAGFGFDASVAQAMLETPWLTGEALYLFASARQLFAFRGLEIDVVPDRAIGFRNRLLLAICNGRRFGGSFVIAPNAMLDDGQLDAITIGEATPLRRAALFAAATGGTHLGFPEVTERRASSFLLRFRAPPVFQADGELHQAVTTELEVGCLPRALRVVTSGGASTRPTP